MLLDTKLLAPGNKKKCQLRNQNVRKGNAEPELVHVPHLCVEHGKEPKEKIEPDHIGEIEAYVPLVREQY